MIASIAMGSAFGCTHEASAPTVTRPLSATAGATEPVVCIPERCLAHVVDTSADYVLFERFDVPDPESEVWSDPPARRRYLEAARLTESDVPAPCRPEDTDCSVHWDMQVVGVAQPAEGGCARATIALQLVLEDGAGEEARVGAPRSFEDDLVGLEDLDAASCEEDLDE